MNRSILTTGLAFVLCASASVQAGVPDPSRSSLYFRGGSVPCQLRFRADGGLDCLTVFVVLRDAFEDPVGQCLTSATLTPNAGTLAFCSCCPVQQTRLTNSAGEVAFLFKNLGGRGTLEVCVTALCQGKIAIGCVEFSFTSPDLDGDCLDTDVVDLGLWASCLDPSPYCVASDYTCDGTVDVLDLGIFAGGLVTDCSDASCP